jgi:hypothetical protein
MGGGVLCGPWLTGTRHAMHAMQPQDVGLMKSLGVEVLLLHIAYMGLWWASQGRY